MSAARFQPFYGVRRCLSVSVLLALLFLPLHVHTLSANSAQLTKECICLHGSRTQAGPAVPHEPCVSLIVVGKAAPPIQVAWRSLSFHQPSSRAPPLSISL